MERALDAIRQCRRWAWWDGSAVGLRTEGFAGLLDELLALDETPCPGEATA